LWIQVHNPVLPLMLPPSSAAFSCVRHGPQHVALQRGTRSSNQCNMLQRSTRRSDHRHADGCAQDDSDGSAATAGPLTRSSKGECRAALRPGALCSKMLHRVPSAGDDLGTADAAYAGAADGAARSVYGHMEWRPPHVSQHLVTHYLPHGRVVTIPLDQGTAPPHAAIALRRIASHRGVLQRHASCNIRVSMRAKSRCRIGAVIAAWASPPSHANVPSGDATRRAALQHAIPALQVTHAPRCTAVQQHWVAPPCTVLHRGPGGVVPAAPPSRALRTWAKALDATLPFESYAEEYVTARRRLPVDTPCRLPRDTPRRPPRDTPPPTRGHAPPPTWGHERTGNAPKHRHRREYAAALRRAATLLRCNTDALRCNVSMLQRVAAWLRSARRAVLQRGWASAGLTACDRRHTWRQKPASPVRHPCTFARC
jgi:hypothetical protein